MHAKNIKPSAKREMQTERSATIESRTLSALKLASEARDENVPAERADFFACSCTNNDFTTFNCNFTNSFSNLRPSTSRVFLMISLNKFKKMNYSL